MPPASNSAPAYEAGRTLSGRANINNGRYGDVFACAFSPDGERVAFATLDSWLILAAVSSGELLCQLRLSAAGNSLVWLDKANLLTACNDGKVIAINVTNMPSDNPPKRTVFDDGRAVVACAIGLYGVVAVACSDTRIVLLDPTPNGLYTTLAELPVAASSPLTKMAFSRDGHILIAGSYLGELHVFHGQSKSNFTHILTLKYHAASIRCIDFSPSGTRVVIGSDDKKASVWNTPTARSTPATWDPIATLYGHRQQVYGAAFLDDHYVVTCSGDGTLRIWEAMHGTALKSASSSNALCSMTFDAASSLIACGKRGGTLELFPRCAKFLRSAGEAQPYVDAQTRCARAEQAARDIERELATADPAILEADKIERELMECIRQLEDQLRDKRAHQAALSSKPVSDEREAIATLREKQNLHLSEQSVLTSLLQHVSDCVINGYFSDLAGGETFDEWLFQCGMGHFCGRLPQMDGRLLASMTIETLEQSGVEFVDACALHLRCFMARTYRTVEVPTDLIDWNVRGWLREQDRVFAPLISLNWDGPALCCAAPQRIANITNLRVSMNDARRLRGMIAAYIGGMQFKEQVNAWMDSMDVLKPDPYAMYDMAPPTPLAVEPLVMNYPEASYAVVADDELVLSSILTVSGVLADDPNWGL